MIFDDVRKNIKKNEFGSRCINIGLENVAVDVYKTPAKIIIFSSKTTDPETAFTSLLNAPEPHRASSV